jgi:hypothetical protein
VSTKRAHTSAKSTAGASTSDQASAQLPCGKSSGPTLRLSQADFVANTQDSTANAWYFILEGTGEQTVAEAQAMVIIEVVAHAADQYQHRAPGDPAGLR